MKNLQQTPTINAATLQKWLEEKREVLGPGRGGLRQKAE
jgi:hypothetical protein